MRFEKLNGYLRSLNSMNKDGDYDQEIQNVLNEINNELGVGSEKALTSYSTKELHEELVKREGVSETIVNKDEEVLISIFSGQESETKTVLGPTRIIVNQD